MTDEPGGAPQVTELQRSSRDLALVRDRLERWLHRTLGPGCDPAIADLRPTSATGMSSDTLLFTASWRDAGRRRSERLVARLAPDAADVPVFPSYDMQRQFTVMRLVRELTAVPLPRVRWLERDPSALGVAFFVMDRVDGEVPPDVMPYNFGDSWLYAASPADQARLQEETVALLAELHRIAADDPRFDFLAFAEPGDTPLRRHVAHTRAWYEFAAGGGPRSPLIDRAFVWLEEHWPAHESPPVVCWGDARIGNILYRDFSPVAALDWEMAALGPRELDVAWLIYAHRVFEDIAASLGLPGMPHFMRADDVLARYEALTGYEVRDLDFYTTYAAIQYAIVFLRTGRRQVHFRERPAPEHVDELLYNREPLERMIAGAPRPGGAS